MCRDHRWRPKPCEKGCGRSLAFDLTWRELEDNLTQRQLTERAASLKFEYRFSGGD